MWIQATVPAQTVAQQMTPYVVGFVGVVLAAVGGGVALVVKAFATKIVAQLQSNHDAYLGAAKETDTKVDKVISQTNGINQNLQKHIDAQNKVIAGLQQNQKPGDTSNDESPPV